MKDKWPMRAFQFGSASFVAVNDNEDSLLAYFTATEQYEGGWVWIDTQSLSD